MKRKIYLLLLFNCFIFKVYSQQIDNNSSIYKSIPQERVFVHYNSTFLLSGEQLLYKVYCLNSKTNRFTKLSKVAYVELVDSDLKVHFKHKILLNSGFGEGDFFIPASIKSGNYKIIAYTKWMQNGGDNNFFQGNISILNPFTDNSNFLSVKNETDSINNVTKTKFNNSSNKLILSLNKKKYTNRESVSLIINSPKIEDFYGNYSISVRKIDSFLIPEKYNSITYQSLFTEENLIKTNSNKIYLPEFRGELISGKVVEIDSKKIVPEIDISISIPGKDYVFKVSKTDQKGNFYFNLDKEYNSSKATLQIDNANSEKYQIILHDEAVINYRNIVFHKFKLTEKAKKIIEKRSIYNQIENAYNAKKQDSLIKYTNADKFYSSKIYTYYLDDYTRFKTLKETLTEITEHIYYSRKGDEYSIKLLGFDFFFKNNKPLILIDGLQILNHNEIIDLKSKQIKKITVVKDNYIYGTKTYNGVIILETFNGNYENKVSKEYKKNINLFKPLIPKKYFKQKYDSVNDKRIPDYRYQLFWEQNFKLSKNTNSIQFFTSDDIGKYEISLEGFTNKGKPISLKTFFEVK